MVHMAQDTVAVVCAIVAAAVAIVTSDCTTRSDFTAQIGGLSDNFTTQIDRLREEVTGQIVGLRTDFRGIDNRLRAVEVTSGRIEQRLAALGTSPANDRFR